MAYLNSRQLYARETHANHLYKISERMARYSNRDPAKVATLANFISILYFRAAGEVPAARKKNNKVRVRR
jgi:hypothetical protein